MIKYLNLFSNIQELCKSFDKLKKRYFIIISQNHIKFNTRHILKFD